jgi:2-polyprenyl-3-methyl-5-hydroxy-6-metoxy-1,4-benzoquinol methylase
MDTMEPNIYEEAWKKAIAERRNQFGDIEAHLRFLQVLGYGYKLRLLEVGCGTGVLTSAMYCKGFITSGIDISPSAIQYGITKYSPVDLRCGSADNIPFPEATFDCVLSFDLIEHLQDVDSHIEEVKRVLKPRGYYLLETPNKLTNIIWETFKTKSIRWRQYHPSLQYPGQLRRLLERHGFSVEFVKVDIRSPYLTKKLGKFLGKFDFRLLPYWFQPNLYVISELNK